jgi:uncharacterized membrane protein
MAETLMRSRRAERQGDPSWQDVHPTHSLTLIPSLPSLSLVKLSYLRALRGSVVNFLSVFLFALFAPFCGYSSFFSKSAEKPLNFATLATVRLSSGRSLLFKGFVFVAFVSFLLIIVLPLRLCGFA